jgi:UDP-N-acetylglucosamine--N-acetylmuramyl-(pentapeptide) pyrophosphoryl-undecaprenol N-acetylglucosamine transferase
MDEVYSAADLVVCRAGAMTVAELAVAGVPSVLVPLPGSARRPPDGQCPRPRAGRGSVLLPDGDCEPDILGRLIDRLLEDRRPSLDGWGGQRLGAA